MLVSQGADMCFVSSFDTEFVLRGRQATSSLISWVEGTERFVTQRLLDVDECSLARSGKLGYSGLEITEAGQKRFIISLVHRNLYKLYHATLHLMSL